MTKAADHDRRRRLLTWLSRLSVRLAVSTCRRIHAGVVREHSRYIETRLPKSARRCVRTSGDARESREAVNAARLKIGRGAELLTKTSDLILALIISQVDVTV